MAWMHLWRASVAATCLEKLAAGASPGDLAQLAGKNKEVAFYDGQLKTAEYFIQAVLPVTMGKMESIIAANNSLVNINSKSFGG
jgi:hypothetical protein